MARRRTGRVLDASFDSVQVGEASVGRHVDAANLRFVAIWEHRGGKQRSKRRARWLDVSRPAAGRARLTSG